MYSQLINELPTYIRDGFIGARATLLLSDD